MILVGMLQAGETCVTCWCMLQRPKQGVTDVEQAQRLAGGGYSRGSPLMP